MGDSTTRTRTRTIALAATVLLVGAGLYAQPHLILWRMRAAAVRGDAAALSSHVDFPRLRESLKASLSAAMLKRASDEQDTGAAALGALFAGALVDRMVNSMVTPEAVAMMMQGKKPNAAEAPVEPTADLKTSVGYEDLSTFVVTINRPQQSDDMGMVFTRDGLSWKLSAMRLPL